MSTLTQPAFIPQPWAQRTGNFDSIPAEQTEQGRASWATGFPAENAMPVSQGGIPAHYKDFQGVLNTLSTFAWWQQRGGFFTWSADIDYPAGAMVLGSDGKLYLSTQESNTSAPKNPVTESQYWIASDPSDFLPLSGGSITGNLIRTFLDSLYNFAIASQNSTVLGEVFTGWYANQGARLYLRSIEHRSLPGYFSLIAQDAVNTTQLRGSPDGTVLQWDSKDIELVESIGTGYIRYKSGEQFSWGRASSLSAQKSVSFSVPFLTNNAPSVLLTPNVNAVAFVTGLSATGFNINLSSYSTSAAANWVAMGIWK